MRHASLSRSGPFQNKAPQVQFACLVSALCGSEPPSGITVAPPHAVQRTDASVMSVAVKVVRCSIVSADYDDAADRAEASVVLDDTPPIRGSS